MSKKLTYEYVKNYIEIESKSGCKLLSTEYVSNSELLDFECKCTKHFSTTFSKFKDRHKQQCNECSRKTKGDSTRIPFIQVKDFIEVNSNCKLLTQENEYDNSLSSLLIQCNCGNKFITTFKLFKRYKQTCDECGEKIRRENLSLSYQYVKDYIEGKCGNGCKLITNERDFENSRTLLDIQCNCGNLFNSSFTVFSRDVGAKNQCDKCSRINMRKLTKIPYRDVKLLFKNNNCELITTEEEYYNSYNKNVKYKCSCGNKSSISIQKFKEGHRCRKCESDRRKSTNLINNGVEYPAQNPIIMAKVRQTLYNNNSVPTSRQQSYLHNLFSGELNYPCKTSSLDIAFLQEKIYLEYDGSGHNLNVVFGKKSQDEFNQNEKCRNYGLMKSGWKEIRIISSTDKLPCDDKLLGMLDYAKQYLSTGHHYIKFDIDKGNIITSQFTIPYDYGQLRRIYKQKIA